MAMHGTEHPHEALQHMVHCDPEKPELWRMNPSRDNSETMSCPVMIYLASGYDRVMRGNDGTKEPYIAASQRPF